MKKKNFDSLKLTKTIISTFKAIKTTGGGSVEPTICCIDPGASASCARTYCNDFTCVCY